MLWLRKYGCRSELWSEYVKTFWLLFFCDKYVFNRNYIFIELCYCSSRLQLLHLYNSNLLLTCLATCTFVSLQKCAYIYFFCDRGFLHQSLSFIPVVLPDENSDCSWLNDSFNRSRNADYSGKTQTQFIVMSRSEIVGRSLFTTCGTIAHEVKRSDAGSAERTKRHVTICYPFYQHC